MKLLVSEIVTYYRPSRCPLRIYFREKGYQEDPPSPYAEVLLRLGNSHEKSHLETFEEVLDLSKFSIDVRNQRTIEGISKGASVIYQGMLQANITLGRYDNQLVGIPDFIIRDGSDYLIRDSKISRRITEQDHPEILRQLELYGLLYERSLGKPPSRLEVHSGTGEIIEVTYDYGKTALGVLEDIVENKLAASQPFSPVGWSKCTGCSFASICLKEAEKRRDIALVDGVDQGLALALRNQGIESMDDLLKKFDEITLSEFERPWGTRMQRVGKKAGSILTMAEAMAMNKEILLEAPDIPSHSNYVMFDLEGLPPQLDELDKIYLWGVQVFGEKPSDYLSSTADFGPDGDKEGWFGFLQLANRILDQYGDIPFVHWHHYERSHLNAYIERYGDPEGVAARVYANLLDILPITKKCIALPLPSYSLKVIEKYIGFERTQKEYGGDWAMAQYIEAVETGDNKRRSEIMDQLLSYNREDLEATWAVFTWFNKKIE